MTTRELRQILTAVEKQDLTVKGLRDILFEIEEQDAELRESTLMRITSGVEEEKEAATLEKCKEETKEEREEKNMLKINLEENIIEVKHKERGIIDTGCTLEFEQNPDIIESFDNVEDARKALAKKKSTVRAIHNGTMYRVIEYSLNFFEADEDGDMIDCYVKYGNEYLDYEFAEFDEDSKELINSFKEW